MLEFSLTHLHHVGEILTDLIEELLANATFAGEQPMERILIVSRGLLQDIEVLENLVSVE